MKRVFYSLILLLTNAATAQTSFTSFVNPFIGTGGHGHTYPGVVLPFGMMQLSPDTRLDGWDGCSGYHYSDSVIYGFSHTHLSGTGCSDYGDILLMPATTDENHNYAYASHFSHKNEVAKAGYYSVFLDGPKVKAALTATARCGMHQYTFAKNSPQLLVVDLKHRDEVLDSKLEVVDSVTLRGYRFSKAWASNQKVYFEIKFSKPWHFVTANKPRFRKTDVESREAMKEMEVAINNHKTFDRELIARKYRTNMLPEKPMHDTAIIATFEFSNDDKPLLVKVAISAVDEEGAHKNMLAEMPDWNFDHYRKQAHDTWEKELSKIDAKGGTKDQRTIFYTALYHCMSAPNIYNDVDNRYRGRDDQIHSTEGKFDYYTVFSLWDTYRAEHPLLTIIDPKRTNDFINTFIKQYEQGGLLPVWELSSNETNCMIGYHSVSVIWDAYSKGIRGYDAEKAFEAMKHSAMQDRFGLASYKKYGYVRADDASESVSRTLEYAYDDWCIAQMAQALGKTEDYSYFIGRAQNWKNVYDPTTGFMRARRNGTLSADFSPYNVDNNFTEANSWQYSFYVPQDIPGLIAMSGGKEKFEAKLDALFSASTKTTGRDQDDISGLIGQYAHGNEPSHHIAYLYNYVDKPEKTHAIVKQVMDSFYHNNPDGLIGNEDCGQMSAWYVMSALGLYAVCPGKGKYYEAGISPFESVKIKSNGKSIVLNGSKTFAPHDTTASINIIVHNRATEIRDGRDFDRFSANPYINSALRTFKGKQIVALNCDDQKAKVFFSLNGASMQQYHQPILVNEHTNLKFFSRYFHQSYSSIDSFQSPIQEANFTRLPDDRQIILHSTYNNQYSADGPNALIDGIHGTTSWRNGGWQGYQGQDFEGIIAFNEAKDIKTITTSFLEDQRAWIFYPTKVSFYASDDSVKWTLIDAMDTHKPDHDDKVTTSTFSTNKPVKAKFVKVVATQYGPVPQWYEGSGNPSFIFIDEIGIQ